MGATKRVAEMVVRDLAPQLAHEMTAVRFGNVLGSAGSVVPLFKEQIARGGPVTVTHPECTRYFMTIPEAVGLVLVAGLGDYGELCVLDMGEPIRVDELARHMITLAGRVAGTDVKIVYTGLRPGEKLYEELLTEEEEQAHAVRDRIRVAKSPPPPPTSRCGSRSCARLADAGDREGSSASCRRSSRPTAPSPARPRARTSAARSAAAAATRGLAAEELRPRIADPRPRSAPEPDAAREGGASAPAVAPAPA